MRVARICKSAYATLDGEGARVYGGRWNSVGIPAVYLASTRSLALLEVLVHLGSIQDLASDFVCAVVRLPDEIVRFESSWWSSTSRPHWARKPRNETQVVGDTWMREHPDLVLAVPSVIVPEEDNFLFHPSLVDSGAIVIEQLASFSFDPRLLLRL